MNPCSKLVGCPVNGKTSGRLPKGLNIPYHAPETALVTTVLKAYVICVLRLVHLGDEVVQFENQAPPIKP